MIKTNTLLAFAKTIVTPKTCSSNKHHLNKSFCWPKNLGFTITTQGQKLGCDRSSPLKMNLVPEIRKQALTRVQSNKSVRNFIFISICSVVGGGEVPVLPPLDYFIKTDGCFSSQGSWVPCSKPPTDCT